MEQRCAHSKDRGFTLIEVLVTLSLSAALLGITAATLREYNRSSKNALSLIQSFVKQARIKGISRTAAYKVFADSSGKKILTSFADKCASTTFVPDTALVLEMPVGTKLLSPTWSVCFNARGLTESNITISVATEDSGTKSIEILLGGGTREV
jgi:prepilin-type N-terminal cleavage/methylation domain-containing protein